jgi:hydroxymethylpyrimidine/phosphomethylpyrimidine kinase
VTRSPAPVSLPVALTVAGSDSGGGAGIQADVKTMAARGAFPTSVVTGVTAQHTRGVEGSTALDAADVRAQYEAVVDDVEVRAAKTGMLATAEIVQTVRDCVADAAFPLVVDPVVVATSGDRLLDSAGERAYEDLLAAATLATPNRDETAVLTGITPTNRAEAREAGARLRETGADAALVKGVPGEDAVRDVLVTADGYREFAHPRIDSAPTHGTGCCLSAAIAAHLSAGTDLEPAVERGVALLERALRYPHDVGGGAAPVHPLVALRNEAAAESTAEAVRDLVDAFVSEGVGPLVPEVGMNVVGATPYAESVDETAAVEGRLSRTTTGVAATGGIRFGASSHLARFLLAAREHAPDLRFVTNCRLTDATRSGLADLDGRVAWFDRREEPEAASTMDWAAERVVSGAGERPVAVADEGAVGKEPMIRVVGERPSEVEAVARQLLAAASDSE